MLHLICNIIKNNIHTEEKPYGKSIHTGEEPYIFDFIIVSFIKKTRFTRITPVKPFGSNQLLCSQRTIGCKVIDNSMLKSSCSFCSVKLMLIIIKEQHLYFSWLCILGIELRFWTSHIHVEHCSMIPLTRLFYTISWSRHQNVFTLVQLGCKENAWYSCLYMLIVMILCFFKNILQDIR